VDVLQAPDFLLLCSNTAASVAAARLCAVLATPDALHDLVEQGDTAGVCLDSSLGILIGGVELDSVASKLEGACKSTARGRTMRRTSRHGVWDTGNGMVRRWTRWTKSVVC